MEGKEKKKQREEQINILHSQFISVLLNFQNSGILQLMKISKPKPVFIIHNSCSLKKASKLLIFFLLQTLR